MSYAWCQAWHFHQVFDVETEIRIALTRWKAGATADVSPCGPRAGGRPDRARRGRGACRFGRARRPRAGAPGAKIVGFAKSRRCRMIGARPSPRRRAAGRPIQRGIEKGTRAPSSSVSGRSVFTSPIIASRCSWLRPLAPRRSAEWTGARLSQLPPNSNLRSVPLRSAPSNLAVRRSTPRSRA